MLNNECVAITHSPSMLKTVSLPVVRGIPYFNRANISQQPDLCGICALSMWAHEHHGFGRICMGNLSNYVYRYEKCELARQITQSHAHICNVNQVLVAIMFCASCWWTQTGKEFRSEWDGMSVCSVVLWQQQNYVKSINFVYHVYTYFCVCVCLNKNALCLMAFLLLYAELLQQYGRLSSCISCAICLPSNPSDFHHAS